MEFKGSKEIHAVEHGWFIRLNNEPRYNGLDLLNFEDVGEEVVKANAKLYKCEKMKKDMERLRELRKEQSKR